MIHLNKVNLDAGVELGPDDQDILLTQINHKFKGMGTVGNITVHKFNPFDRSITISHTWVQETGELNNSSHRLYVLWKTLDHLEPKIIDVDLSKVEKKVTPFDNIKGITFTQEEALTTSRAKIICADLNNNGTVLTHYQLRLANKYCVSVDTSHANPRKVSIVYTFSDGSTLCHILSSHKD